MDKRHEQGEARWNEPAALIEKADKEFAQALLKVDLAKLDNTYADTYTFTEPNGRVSTATAVGRFRKPGSDF